MLTETNNAYGRIRSTSHGLYESKRGLIAVWGKEAVQFLDGMITNDMKTLADGSQMLAAFPNAQGRLLAVVRVLRQGEKYLIETEAATRMKVFNNLFRFTFAGDFSVEDISDQFRCFTFPGGDPHEQLANSDSNKTSFFHFRGPAFESYFISDDGAADEFREKAMRDGGQISDEVYETLRVEAGVPKYGLDMDETTVVPELGIDGLISYNKGCYIGQEIIARIHFRGHVAKRLAGLVSEDAGKIVIGGLTTVAGKEAGRITSTTFSPKLGKAIALGLIRYDFLADGTELLQDGKALRVTGLPFGS